MRTLVIATRNLHKLDEIREILGAGFDYLSLGNFPAAPAIIEDAPTFAGNALKKATELARWLAHEQPAHINSFVLADDSGLEVDALRGAPGVHSARFAALDSTGGRNLAGPDKTANSADAENNAKLLRLLRDVPTEKRTARFRCVLALVPLMAESPKNASPVCALDEQEVVADTVEGVCEGRIAFAPSGKGGFGYDPLFIPEGYEISFAELGAEVKNRISHRSRALESLKGKLGKPGTKDGSKGK